MEIEWIGNLETRVREAVERLGDLREENRTLREAIQDLETRLAALPTAAPPASPNGRKSREELETLRTRVRDLEEELATTKTERAAAAAAAKSWEAEREEVRRRMEALVERLEGLAG